MIGIVFEMVCIWDQNPTTYAVCYTQRTNDSVKDNRIN